MSARNGISLLLLALALAVGLVAILSPWWTITFVPQEDDDGVRQVGPFDAGGGWISEKSALLSGVIVVAGLVAISGSIAMLGLGMSANRAAALTNAPLVALAGGALIVLALVFVVFAYPNDFRLTSSFWGGDVATNEPTGFTRVDAAYGWYLGIAAVVLSGTGAALGWRKQDPVPHAAQEADASQN